MSTGADLASLDARLRAFAARLDGYDLEIVPRPFGHSLYLRWENRGVKRALEVHLTDSEPASVDLWATASKARRDRSLRMAHVPLPVASHDLDTALEAGWQWAERWSVQDFFA